MTSPSSIWLFYPFVFWTQRFLACVLVKRKSGYSPKTNNFRASTSLTTRNATTALTSIIKLHTPYYCSVLLSIRETRHLGALIFYQGNHRPRHQYVVLVGLWKQSFSNLFIFYFGVPHLEINLPTYRTNVYLLLSWWLFYCIKRFIMLGLEHCAILTQENLLKGDLDHQLIKPSNPCFFCFIWLLIKARSSLFRPHPFPKKRIRCSRRQE